MIVLCVWRCGTGLAGVPILLGFMFGTFGIAELFLVYCFVGPRLRVRRNYSCSWPSP